MTLQTIEADPDDYIIRSGSFQAIVSIFRHLLAAVRASLHNKVGEGLEPDTGGPRNLERLMSLEELRQKLDQLGLSHAIEIERDIHEGSYHHGSGAVVQMLGVRPE